MKIMTQNADTLLRGANSQKIRHLAQKIIQENITLIAMNNVVQSLDAAPLPSEMLEGAQTDEGLQDLRRDNPAAMLAQLLKQCGKSCSLIWFSDCKTDGFRKKGTAFLSVGRRIRCVDRFALGAAAQPVLGVQLEGMEDWFYQLSADSWDVPKEKFLSQWKLLNGCITGKRLCSPVWLIGGFGTGSGDSRENRDSLVAGGWTEVSAEKGSVWCSRRREALACQSSDRIFKGRSFGMVIDVKEDTL